MIVIYLPGLICLIGLLIYLLTKPELAKVAEVGRIMFWVGLLVFLLSSGHLATLIAKP
jgi:hypothetical protein